ncbi:MAG: hypothetical protein HYY86_03295 [Candidatus Harrisonbacteria bacterium]|nr:hypothetical protein [Candidatus Harrisonbacteria bacterium]
MQKDERAVISALSGSFLIGFSFIAVLNLPVFGFISLVVGGLLVWRAVFLLKKDKERSDLKRWREMVGEAKEICKDHPSPKPPIAPKTVDCLRTLEIEEFNQGKKLSPERVAHIRQCRGCRALLPEVLSDE